MNKNTRIEIKKFEPDIHKDILPFFFIILTKHIIKGIGFTLFGGLKKKGDWSEHHPLVLQSQRRF